MTEFTALSGNGDTCMTKWDLFLTAYHSFSMNSQVFTIWVCRIQGMNHKPAFFFCVFCLICYFSDALFASLHVSRLFLRQFQTRPPGVGFNSWLICFVLTLVICSGSGLLSQRHWTNGAVLTAHFAYFGEGGGLWLPSVHFSDPNGSGEPPSCDGAAHSRSPAWGPRVRTCVVHDNLIRISCGFGTHSHNAGFFVPFFGSRQEKT